MATTWMKSLHVNKGKSIARTLAERTDYAENPGKTDRGRLVTGYACDPHVADEQFLLAKKEYEYLTGRNQGAHNVLAYHIRQAFKPGEVSAAEANEIGRELAARFFKNKHAYMNEVTELQKYIGQYGKTRAVYEAYKRSSWSQNYYDEHTADIILHRSAKSYFNKLGLKKLPSINQLKQEWGTLATEKRALYAGYRDAKENAKALAVALGNANHILGIEPDAKTAKNRGASHETPRWKEQEL